VNSEPTIFGAEKGGSGNKLKQREDHRESGVWPKREKESPANRPMLWAASGFKAGRHLRCYVLLLSVIMAPLPSSLYNSE
jgi:hypothetical protein